jgi:hypothetical protein
MTAGLLIGTVKPSTAPDVTAQLAFLTRPLRMPTFPEAVPRLAERARCERLDTSFMSV